MQNSFKSELKTKMAQNLRVIEQEMPIPSLK